MLMLEQAGACTCRACLPTPLRSYQALALCRMMSKASATSDTCRCDRVALPSPCTGSRSPRDASSVNLGTAGRGVRHRSEAYAYKPRFKDVLLWVEPKRGQAAQQRGLGDCDRRGLQLNNEWRGRRAASRAPRGAAAVCIHCPSKPSCDQL